MRIDWRHWMAGIGCLLSAVRPLPAQEPVQRAALAAFQDSLAALRDTAAVGRIEQRLLDAVRRTPRDAMLHLRLGWVALRLGELGGGNHFDNAASEFQYATDLQPTWPWGWYGVGVAELRVAEGEESVSPQQRTRLREDAGVRAAAALGRAVERDASIATLIPSLAAGWRGRGAGARVDVLLSTTRRLAGLPASHDSAMLVLRGTLERAAGSADSAVRIFQLLGARYPGPEMLYELARSRFKAWQLDTDGAWYRGLELAGPALLARYREDLRPILSAAELQRFDRASPADRVAQMRAFFLYRDVRDILSAGGRLRVHYARLWQAATWYTGFAGLFMPNAALAFLQGNGGLPWDDRALVAIRQGMPPRHHTDNVTGPRPNETWQFDDDDTLRTLHFTALVREGPFQLIDGFTDLLGSWRPGKTPPTDGLRVMLEAHESFGTVYRELATATGSTWARADREERRQVAAARTWALTTDRATFTGFAFPAAIGIVGFGEGPGQPSGRLLLALPHGPTPYQPMVHVTLQGRDTSMVLIDTLFTTNIFPDHLALPIPPGEWTVRAAVTTIHDSVLRLPPVHLTIPNGTERLSLSDLALGSSSAHLSWVFRAGDTLRLLPTGHLAAGERLDVVAQVTSAAPPASYRVETLVTRRRDGGGLLGALARLVGGAVVTVIESRTVVSPGAEMTWIRQDLDTRALRPGSYRVRMTVTAPDGTTARRELAFAVESR